MKKIAIIMTGDLPVPSVKGGAVETLIDIILESNEENNCFNTTIYSTYDTEAFKASKKFKNSKFVYFDINRKFNSSFIYLSKIFRKIFGTSYKSLFIKKVIKDIKKKNYDLVLVEGESRVVRYISKNVKTKILLHLHSNSLNNKLVDGKKIIDSCYKVITVSNYIKKEVLTLGEEFSDKVQVLKNCTDIERFDKTKYLDFRNEFRKENNIKENEKLLLFSGRINPDKGVKELIEAFKLVDNENCKLLIVGSTWFSSDKKSDYSMELFNLSKSISDRVIFTGYVPYKNMPAVYAAADIAIVPSIWDDPAPLVVFEAMATGIPIIATNSGGIPEYVNRECCIVLERDGNLIENLSNSINKLLNDNELCISMGKAARSNSLNFSTKKYYNDFIKMINDI
jgi:spore coat protein SA